mgnify:CR=1 FL=1
MIIGITVVVRLLFPFLIGTVRTHHTPLFFPLFDSVSIPHRYGKNEKLAEKMQELLEVSIPHRYGKNCISMCTYYYASNAFPFLIGTVRTKVKCKHCHSQKLFPFLIGTVRTEQYDEIRSSLQTSFHSS